MVLITRRIEYRPQLARKINAALIGEGGTNIPKIIHWITEVAFTDMSDEALDQSLSDLINKVKSNQAVMSAIKTELPSLLMEKLQRHL
eukprot:TRINITY_DN10272_c0_g1_i1.p1 TRINITY_DN10272_c0_g1~~TRINITY_DN10272_c0_g1_i1.p1  ORF type:complete len:88 (+),score=6.37 TRINITY_DN10272_c0_g1_i1:138-401(+)